MLIAGIDEAGRGPCVGPMVMAVAQIEFDREGELLQIGVKDSKDLSPPERTRQYGLLQRALHSHATAHVQADEIDALRVRKSLNEIEAMRAAELLNALAKKPDVVYVDSPDVLQENFAKRIKKYLSFDATLKSEHKADSRYPVVSAASVLAKVERDRAVKALSKQYGPLGSGYSHDPDTIAFLRKYIAEHDGALPPIVRRSWDTTQKLLTERYQTKLF